MFLSFLAWSFVAVAQEAPVQSYFATEELPDLIRSLPAPPEKGSAAFKYDVKRYRWGKAQRSNPERAAMARVAGLLSSENGYYPHDILVMVHLLK